MSGARGLSDLRTIPGVGPSIERDLLSLGVGRVTDLCGRDPEELYARLVTAKGPQDRCVLYVFRCAVYFAESHAPDPELTQWWSWKDAADPPLRLLRHAGRRGA